MARRGLASTWKAGTSHLHLAGGFLSDSGRGLSFHSSGSEAPTDLHIAFVLLFSKKFGTGVGTWGLESEGGKEPSPH